MTRGKLVYNKKRKEIFKSINENIMPSEAFSGYKKYRIFLEENEILRMEAPEDVYERFCPKDEGGHIFDSLNIKFLIQDENKLIVGATFEYKGDEESEKRVTEYMEKDGEWIKDVGKWQDYALGLVEECMGTPDETFPNAFGYEYSK